MRRLVTSARWAVVLARAAVHLPGVTCIVRTLLPAGRLSRLLKARLLAAAPLAMFALLSTSWYVGSAEEVAGPVHAALAAGGVTVGASACTLYACVPVGTRKV